MVRLTLILALLLSHAAGCQSSDLQQADSACQAVAEPAAWRRERMLRHQVDEFKGFANSAGDVAIKALAVPLIPVSILIGGFPTREEMDQFADTDFLDY